MNRNIAEIMILIGLGFAMVFVMLITKSQGMKLTESAELKENWTITVNDEIIHTDDLAEEYFAMTQKGDVVILETVLPDAQIAMPALNTFFVHSAIDVYLNEQLIYSYGKDLLEQNSTVGYGYHDIILPVHYANQKLRIELFVAENEAFSSIDAPKIVSAGTKDKAFIGENRIPLMLSIFLVVFGIVTSIVSGIGLIAQKEFGNVLCVGLFSLCIGIWSFANYNLLFLFTDNLQMKIYLEFGALYLAPFLLLLYFHGEILQNKIKAVRVGYIAVTITQFLFVIIAFAGQISGKIHFPALLRIQHLLMLIIAIGLAVIFIQDFVQKNFQNIILVIGVAFMIVFAMFDLLRFYLEKYIPAMGTGEFRGFICIGTMLFIMSMLMNFINRISDALYRSAEQSAMNRLAYIDVLTGLSNRRECEEKLDELDEKKTNYGIIIFDLNNLKEVNDRFGHDEGDLLIKTFGEVLQTVFGKIGLVSRIGGDEFTVIIDDVTQLKMEDLFEKLNAEIQKVNTTYHKWDMSTAYGVCCYAIDKIYPTRQALKCADERMYTDKMERKKMRR